MEHTMTFETRFWDNIAEKYAKKPVGNPDAYRRKVDITKANLRADHTVLDVGCGTGTLAVELAPHVAQAHGVDVSFEMVRIAKGRARDANVGNVTFHQTTLNAPLPFSAESFDGICAYNILHLVDEPAETLTTLFRLLKPGGTFISSTPCLQESWVPFGMILPVMRWIGKAPAVHRLRSAELLEQMRKAGFEAMTTPDVGADKMTAFVVARKPHASV